MKSIIFILILILVSSSVMATLTRDISTTSVASSGTFTVTYISTGDTAPYFFSILDSISGGCTVMSSSTIATVLTSPATQTGAITVQAPSSAGTCTFTGDWQLGDSPIVNFASQSVTITGSGNGDDGEGPNWLLIGGVAAVFLVFMMFVSKK